MCTDKNKAFSSTENELYSLQEISCQIDGTWSKKTLDKCVAGTCPNPPIPDFEKYKLRIVWNPEFPTLVGQKVKYSCDAGGYFNRRRDSMDLADYYLECLEPDTFEEPDW